MQRIARILRANQVGERQRHALGGGEAILAIENHAVAAIEHQHGGAGALILALVHHQVGIIEFDRQAGAVALHGVKERGADVHIQRVAKLIRTRTAPGFDAGSKVARVMPSEAALAERCQQVFERLEAEKIERLVGDLKPRLDFRPFHSCLAAGCFRRRRRHPRRLLLRDVAFFLHALDDLVDEVLEFLILREVGILQHLLHQLGRHQVALFQSAQDGFAQLLHVLLARALHIHFVDAVLVVEAALQEEVRHAAHELLQVDVVGRVGRVPGIFCVLHGTAFQFS